MLVIAGDVVMQLLPDQFNPVYPRVIRWLEKNPEFVIVPQKASCHGALVDDVVVRNQRDSPGPAVVPPELGQQQQEDFRVLLLPLHPDDITRTAVEGACQIAFLILPGCRNRCLLPLPGPTVAYPGIEIDVHFIDVKDRLFVTRLVQCTLDSAHSGRFGRVRNAQGRPGAIPANTQLRQQAPNR